MDNVLNFFTIALQKDQCFDIEIYREIFQSNMHFYKPCKLVMMYQTKQTAWCD